MINKYKTIFLASIFFLIHLTTQAQLVVDTPPLSAETILEGLFFGGGVEVLDVNYNGAPLAVGLFDGTNSNIGIDRGILLTSGLATNATDMTIGNETIHGNANYNGDDDLDQLIPGNVSIEDVSVYNIKFIPFDTIVRFTYVWASNEYPVYTCSPYNDVFGFFISGSGINGSYSNNAANIALIPDTDLPVTINNLNSGIPGMGGNVQVENCMPPNGSLDYSDYYIANSDNFDVDYNGFTIPLEASALVVPCDTYDIKIAVADAGDGRFDSGVFLAAGSFGTDALDLTINTFSPDTIMVESCVPTSIELKLALPAEDNFPVDYSIWGTAINGTDYEFVPDNAIIPIGQDSLILVFTPIEDGISEGIESIFIEVQTNICTIDTFALYINDNQLVPPVVEDATICEGQSVSLDATLPIDLPESITFTNSQAIDIPDNDPINPAISEINIVGATPEQVGDGSILSVCVDITHPWDGDLDIYLISPSGQFLELSTDNGGDGMNYTQTCFTPTDTLSIEGLGNTDAPFTGNYLPESSWEDIYDSDMNGTWTLRVGDDSQGFTGQINSWSITLPPIYGIGYRWEPDTGVACPNCAITDLSPSTTTTYEVIATDTYGCSTSDFTTVTVLPTIPGPTITCDNSVGGQLTFSWEVIQGATAYEINVDGTGWVIPSDDISHQVTGLTDGQMVSVQVRAAITGDCNSATSTLTCTATAPACTLLANLDDKEDVSCYGIGDGSVTITTTGGNGNYTFTLNGTAQSDGTFSGLAAGNYSVLIEDTDACATNLPFTITQPDSLILNFISSNISCAGNNDGTIILNASGGTPDYEYNLNGGDFENENTFENLMSGTYTVLVNDVNNCTATKTIILTQPLQFVPTLEATPESCEGGDGMATVVTGIAGSSYMWSDGQDTQTAVSLNGGTYSVTITDQNNCTAIDSIVVGTTAEIQIGVAVTDISCFGADDGTAIILAEGTPPFTYLWDANAGSQTEPTASGLGAGIYTVQVTDSLGCTTGTNVEIKEPEAITLMLSKQDLTCTGEATGSVSVVAEGGTGTYFYEWDDPAGQTNEQATGLLAGTYTVTVTDTNGCQQSDNITITQPAESLTVNATGSMVNCYGDTNGTISLNSTGGTSPYSYSIDNENFTESNVIANLSAGTYTVYAKDATGECTSTVTVTINEPPEFIVELGEDIELDYGDAIILNANPDLSGDYIYSWSSFSPDLYLDCVDCATPEASPLYQTTYTVLVEDENGCQVEDDIRIFVVKKQPVFIANGFTPNNDGVNDRLYIQGAEAAERVVVLQVYDRWGEVVFDNRDTPLNDPESGWDGTFRGEDLNSGMYVWYTEVRFIDGSVLPYKGEITLIR